MLIKSSRLTRRRLLQGLGASTGLASLFFNSPVALGQTTTAPLRFVFVPLQHGWGRDRNIEDFSGSGTSFTLPTVFQPFEAIRQHCVFVDGLRGTLWGNAHDVSYSDIFTASVPWGETSSPALGAHFPEPMGPSIDHVIAQYHNKSVLRISNEYNSWGAPTHPLFFSEGGQVLGQYTSPREAFDAIADPIRAAAGDGLASARLQQQVSLFDYLGQDLQRLIDRTPGDRDRMTQHLGALDAVSQRFRDQTGSVFNVSTLPPRPEASPDFMTSVDLNLELIRIALQADVARIATLGFGQELPDSEFSWTDTSGASRTGNANPGQSFHHGTAHYGSDPDARRAFVAWAQWHMNKIVGFVQALEATPDVDGGSLLDNTIIVLTGEVETGQHDTRSKTHILIGGGAHMQTGRLIQTPKVDPRNRNGVFIGGQERNGTVVTSGINYGADISAATHADLFVALANLAGVPMTEFGFPVMNTPGVFSLT